MFEVVVRNRSEEPLPTFYFPHPLNILSIPHLLLIVMRIDRLRRAQDEEGLGGYLITRTPNIFYYTGSTGGGILLSTPEDEPMLLVSKMSFEMARAEAKGCEIQTYERGTLLEKIGERLKGVKSRVIGFDELRLGQYLEFKEKLEGFEFKSKPEIVSKMRSIKDEEEISRIKRACKLADAGMEAVRSSLREGMREYEVAAELEYGMRRAGAEGIAFATIIGSGPRAAYPHAGCTDREISRGDFIVIDAGATYKGYRSDITRTFIVGRPSGEQKRIYEIVLEANERALDEIREGVEGKAVDGLARNIISEAGYGEFFTHSLGHGVGLEVHESPSLSSRSESILKARNVVTDEPGVYIAGLGGVRIEDTVLVMKDRAERLTKFGKSLEEMTI